MPSCSALFDNRKMQLFVSNFAHRVPLTFISLSFVGVLQDAMANVPVVMQRDPFWTEKLAKEERKKAVLTAPDGYADTHIRKVHPKDAPQLPSNTATAQIHVRAVSTVENPQEGSIPADCFPPAQLKDRSWRPGVPIGHDTRQRAVRAVKGMQAGGMPAIMAVSTFKGPRLEEADEIVFCGISLTAHDAKAVSESEYDEAQTIQTSGMTNILNMSQHKIPAFSVVHMGPPPMQPVKKDNGDIDTTKFPKSNIVQLREGSAGDGSDCPFVASIIDVSEPALRFYTIFENWETSAEKTFSPEHLMKWLHYGDADSAEQMLRVAWDHARVVGRADTRARAEVKRLLGTFFNTVRSLHPHEVAVTEDKNGQVSVVVDGTPALRPMPPQDVRNHFLMMGDDDAPFINMLARLSRDRPGQRETTAKQAADRYKQTLVEQMQRYGYQRHGGANDDAEILYLTSLSRSAGGMVRSIAVANKYQYLYAVLRRRNIFSCVLESLAGTVKASTDIVKTFHAMAHILTVADSAPGGPMAGQLLLHPA